MRHQTLAALVVALIFCVCTVRVDAQSCVGYQPDPRLEPYESENELVAAMAQADILVVSTAKLELQPGGDVYRMTVEPWTILKALDGPVRTGCPDRDYHGQPTPGSGGSGVLVGDALVLTVQHLVQNTPNCQQNLRFVFGYGNFSANQWQLNCEGGGDECWVNIAADDVYRCESAVVGQGPINDDWAVVELDRPVTGGEPLEIRRDPNPLPDGTPIAITGHPNHIPMKSELNREFKKLSAEVQYRAIGAHVLINSSGSMAVEESTGEVVGIVRQGFFDILAGCGGGDCFRERFVTPSDPNNNAVALITPAYLAADNIP